MEVPCRKCEELEATFCQVRTQRTRLLLSGADSLGPRLEELNEEELGRLWAYLQHRTEQAH